ncbi:regucalcin-like [Vanessa atalanta]|uniref:regucalcin-like n=1 Tax=Vanessa atalanta TaxID=42275 RepID=UPI001FCDD363|nr:regucalcin-like [Vanessa atalanta]
MWIKITLLTVFLVIITVGSFRSTTPLIKNVYRGGEHFEGPHFAKDEGALYWVDISQQKVYRLDVDTGNITRKNIGYGPVSLVIRVKDYPKLVLVTSRTEVYFLSWDAKDEDTSLRLLSAVDIGFPDNRCNDGKVDAKGRLWLGTMGKEEMGTVDKDQGSLYMITENDYINPETKVRPVSVSNGIAWTADNKFMFYIDSATRNIDVFNFDLETGTIKNRRVLFSFQANNVTGVPDGMTIDRDGNLWVACYGGGLVIKIDSRAGKLMEQHKIPASQVTSVMWGGYDYSILYVTTANRDLNPVQKAQEPEAGSLFAIYNTGATGFPENQFVFGNADKY